MMRRILAGILIIVIPVVGFAAFLLLSSTGLGLIAGYASKFSGGSIVIAESEGRLLGTWVLRGVSVKTPGADVVVGEMSCNWQPSRLLQKDLHLGDVRVDDVEVLLRQNNNTPDETENTFELPTISLPIGILLERLEVTRGTIKQAESLSPLFLLDSFVLKMSGSHEHLVIEMLSLETPGYGGILHGELQLREEWPLQLQADWWFEQGEVERLEGVFSVSGSVVDPVVLVETTDPVKGILKGHLTNVLKDPSWQITLTTDDVRFPDISSGLPDITVALEVETSGTLSDFQGNLKGSLAGVGIETISADFIVHGSQTELFLDHGIISVGSGTVDTGGEISWKNDLGWELSVLLKELDPSFYPGLPSGKISGEVTTRGAVRGGDVSYRVGIQGLEGELSEPFFAISGELDLEGSDIGIELLSSHLVLAEGSSELQGSLSWENELNWTAHCKFQDLNPAIIDSAPEGRITGEINSSGSLLEGDIEMTAELLSLSGGLAGYDLDGRGMVSYKNGLIRIDRLQLENGGNSVSVDGFLDEKNDLTFAVNVPEPNMLVPDLHGMFTTEGMVRGTRNHPEILISYQGKALSYLDYSVEKLGGTVDASLADSGTVEANFSAEKINAAGIGIEKAGLNVSGSVDKHLATIEVISDFGRIDAELSGKLEALSRWFGTLGKIDYKHPLYGHWHQQGQADLAIGSDDMMLSELCLDSGENDICAGGSWSVENGWAAEVSKVTFMLNSLNEWGLLQTTIEGKLKGQVTVAGKNTRLTIMDGLVTIPELDYGSEVEELYDSLRWFDTRLEIGLENQELATEISSRFVDESYVSSSVKVSGFGDFSQPVGRLPLEGNLDIKIKDLSPLVVLTKAYLVPSGQINSDLTVSGIIEDPIIEGSLNLTDGEMKLPSVGIALKEVSGSILGRKKGISLVVEALSGEGEITAKGDIVFDKDEWGGDFKITGQDVEVMNQSEIGLFASPDVSFVFTPNGGNLSGKLIIPKARIEPEEMEGSDSQSADVVLIDEEEQITEWPFLIELEIELGEEVHVDGYGLTGDLRGGINVSTGEKGGMTGLGELYLADSFVSIYGRRLEISRGRVIFDGGPIDSPGLDISATKTIKADGFGESDVVVGVNITGVVYDYNVELFSVPDMDESMIFAYLVLDKSSASGEGEGTIINAAAGSLGLDTKGGLLGKVGEVISMDEVRLQGGGLTDDSSLVVGKRITDELMISYDYSLFKNIGFFKIRYDFGHGFFAETKSSSESNGIDFLYSFER